jgi:hypothetical protein
MDVLDAGKTNMFLAEIEVLCGIGGLGDVKRLRDVKNAKPENGMLRRRLIAVAPFACYVYVAFHVMVGPRETQT